MKALRIAHRRLAPRAGSSRLVALVLGGLAIAAAGALGFSALSSRAAADAATVTVPLAPARAAALVEATAGADANDMQAVGDQAKMINAALPFSGGPLYTARPFELSGSAIDARRALLCLTQAVYYESGFEPVEGRRAVAQVVLNRMRHPAFPKSVCGVVYQGAGSGVCQFTFVCDGALYRAPARDAWLEAEKIARAALAGYVEPSVGEATFYHADYVAPRWAPMLSKVAQIGQHIFYRWPGQWGQPAAFSGRYIGEPRDPLSMRPAPSAIVTPEVDSPEIALADAGPPVPRAPDDVGGLLDTSKGWTLHIPGPDESDSATARALAAQQGKPATAAIASAAANAGPIVASR